MGEHKPSSTHTLGRKLSATVARLAGSNSGRKWRFCARIGLSYCDGRAVFSPWRFRFRFFGLASCCTVVPVSHRRLLKAMGAEGVITRVLMN